MIYKSFVNTIKGFALTILRYVKGLVNTIKVLHFAIQNFRPCEAKKPLFKTTARFFFTASFAVGRF
jgi:hypothetical protein